MLAEAPRLQFRDHATGEQVGFARPRGRRQCEGIDVIAVKHGELFRDVRSHAVADKDDRNSRVPFPQQFVNPQSVIDQALPAIAVSEVAEFFRLLAVSTMIVGRWCSPSP